MVALISLVAALLVVTPSSAVPFGSQSGIPKLKFPDLGSSSFWCNIPILDKLMCPRGTLATSNTSVSTPLGTAQGVIDTSGVVRFAVTYGSADRWEPSFVATLWELPTGASNASGYPLACPQSDLDSDAYSEDCLAMLLYVPPGLIDAPVLVWIHGGSFIEGSATDPGLDGSTLANNAEAIVAVVQYRLGALGFMAPSGATNLAVQDIMTALEFLQTVVSSFGGDASMITLDGESSGANMIRAILAAPSASDLFQYAILQSDPMDYGFLNTTIQDTLQTYYNEQLPCDSGNTTCLNDLSLDTILSAQSSLMNDADNLSLAAGASEPIRPVHDGTLITSTLDSTSPFPSVSKSVMLTNVKDEAMYTIYGYFSEPISDTYYEEYVDVSFGEPRAARLLAFSSYAVSTASEGSDTQDARPQLQVMGTDQVWRCPTWTFARNWVANGGTAYVGVYVVGASYPGNSAVSECTLSGSVCHQDDIEIVFGTVSNPNVNQSALINEMQQRYYEFIRTGDPNYGSYATWTPATNTTIDALELGGSGIYPAGACEDGYWGSYVEYDYQFYDL
ncbi:alpha/beta-hydrolase [Laetiporus sulphureus 93-53]|uniref:Carboxylic ester hydrolase n=1 Tax=Laetiporus sulphureus 93-53 TaxID=1314785 RepID=A0A165G3P1_9APHY|nr:alpha/beta-hydrolase [Laetiporus sulphureus 93-53]KZT09783.1 alpha/beta-hydrolase [Laetiporus sulphureus 93-53]